MHIDHKKKKISRVLSFSKDEFSEAVRRIQGLVKSRNDNAVAVDILGVVTEIIDRKKRESSVIPDIKNPDVKRFWFEIVRLRQMGKGAILISKEIQKRHDVSISKTTIEKYLKEAGKWLI